MIGAIKILDIVNMMLLIVMTTIYALQTLVMMANVCMIILTVMTTIPVQLTLANLFQDASTAPPIVMITTHVLQTNVILHVGARILKSAVMIITLALMMIVTRWLDV
jgi:hypothetical protein